jgi:hypothetical protein
MMLILLHDLVFPIIACSWLARGERAESLIPALRDFWEARGIWLSEWAFCTLCAVTRMEDSVAH